MSNMEAAHAVSYAHGLVSDPSRPQGHPTWETAAEVLRRYEKVPHTLYVFEDCTDGVIGHVPFGAHRCTYQAAA